MSPRVPYRVAHQVRDGAEQTFFIAAHPQVRVDLDLDIARSASLHFHRALDDLAQIERNKIDGVRAHLGAGECQQLRRQAGHEFHFLLQVAQITLVLGF